MKGGKTLDRVYTIYAIMCNSNKKMYIGRTSLSAEERIKVHLSLLRRGKHTNKKMQEDFYEKLKKQLSKV